MHLTWISIESFKCITKVRLELSRVNVLVGANSSGKSSVLQALHLAGTLMRQAREISRSKPSTLNVTQVDYLPTIEYVKLAHNTEWGNRNGSPASTIRLGFSDSSGGNAQTQAFCELRRARNEGISIRGEVPFQLSTLLRREVFTAYIPGLSGIPNQEAKQSKRVVLKACSHGESNVFLRNALDLIGREDRKTLCEWLATLIGSAHIDVWHSDDRDLYINATARVHGHEIPLELLGTGYLQLIQIFCYILLFKPKLLLIDEPDTHLHPDVQERLIPLLDRIASEMSLTVILSTHSPFIVRGGTDSTNVYWLSNGKVQQTARPAIELKLGWGAFGRKILIISEDSDVTLLKMLIAQWPDLERQVAFYPRNGIRTIPREKETKDILEALGRTMKILIHRDRDALTEDEMKIIRSRYDDSHIGVWFPEQWDVESYFCGTRAVAALNQISEDDAQSIINEAVSRRKADFESQFVKCRKAINDELYGGGGSPVTETLWEQCLAGPVPRVKGKTLMREILNQNRFGRDDLLRESLRKEIAPDLKRSISGLLRST